MKLVTSRIAHADTITTDDGVMLGVLYYSLQPIDDEFHKPSEVFREWFKEADDALLLFTTLEEDTAEKAERILALSDEEILAAAKPEDLARVKALIDEAIARNKDVPPTPAG